MATIQLTNCNIGPGLAHLSNLSFPSGVVFQPFVHKPTQSLGSVLHFYSVCSIPRPKLLFLQIRIGSQAVPPTPSNKGLPSVSVSCRSSKAGLFQWAAVLPRFTSRGITTFGNPVESVPQDYSSSVSVLAPRIKFKRLDKTAKNIMQILDKEDVGEVRMKREIPDISLVILCNSKVEVLENKRRVSILIGIVIARHNTGLNTTFRIRRPVAGVGVESLFLLHSPNIKQIMVLDKKKVRRAKFYYLRDKMNALKKQ